MKISSVPFSEGKGRTGVLGYLASLPPLFLGFFALYINPNQM